MHLEELEKLQEGAKEKKERYDAGMQEAEVLEGRLVELGEQGKELRADVDLLAGRSMALGKQLDDRLGRIGEARTEQDERRKSKGAVMKLLAGRSFMKHTSSLKN